MHFLSINANTVHKTTFFVHKYGTPDLPMFPADPDLRTFLLKFLRAGPAAAPAPAAPTARACPAAIFIHKLAFLVHNRDNLVHKRDNLVHKRDHLVHK
jgi:hypothetical protein